MQYRCYVIMNISWHTTMKSNRIMYGYWLNPATEVIIWCLHILCHANLKWDLSAVFAKHHSGLKTDQTIFTLFKQNFTILAWWFNSKYLTQNWKLNLLIRFGIHKVLLYAACLFLFWALRWSCGLSWNHLDVFWLCLSSGLFIIRCCGVILCLTASSCLRKRGVN